MATGSQLPAYSPVSLRSLGAGVVALFGARRARGEVAELVRSAYPVRAVVLTDSGTSALQLALRMAREDAAAGGDPALVALPAWGCFDLGTAALGAGVRFVPYDLDPATLGPDLASLRAALARGARAVVVAHWYGVPVDVASVRALAADHGAFVIEDAAQGVGASIGGVPVGALGDLGVLSFGRGKGRTGGGGGALLATSELGEALLNRVGSTIGPAGAGVWQGVGLGAQWILGRPSLYGMAEAMPFLRLGETVWHDPTPPRGLPGFAAGALVVSWRDSDREVAARVACARDWKQLRPDLVYPETAVPGAVTGFLRLPVVTRNADERTQLLAVPGAMPGYPVPLPAVPQLARIAVGTGPWPGADRLTRDLVTLPCHRWVRPTPGVASRVS